MRSDCKSRVNTRWELLAGWFAGVVRVVEGVSRLSRHLFSTLSSLEVVQILIPKLEALDTKSNPDAVNESSTTLMTVEYIAHRMAM